MGGDFKETTSEIFTSIVETLQDLKEGWQAHNKFWRLKMLILGAFALDVVTTITFVAASGGNALDVTAWFQSGFPSNLVVIRNDNSDPLKDVKLQLDGRYRAVVDRLSPGATGFQIEDEFRDSGDSPPPSGYTPRRLKIESDGDIVELDLVPKN